MPFLQSLGRALPDRVVPNAELAPLLGVDPEWIFNQSGIRERRYAAPEETVVSLGVKAAQACLEQANLPPAELGLILVASGSSDRFCPGPASSLAAGLGLSQTPALDLPMASAGSLAALALAARLAPSMGNILIVGSDIMSRRIDLTPEGRNTAMLFGDGAGAALVSPTHGFARLADSCLFTDGSSAELLRMDNHRIRMDGLLVIRHASRKMPEAISLLLVRNRLRPEDVGTFLLHQANANLITRIARTLDAPADRFFSDIDRFGNTSSASMLIAAAEWRERNPGPLFAPILFSAFGVGLNWGAVLAIPPG